MGEHYSNKRVLLRERSGRYRKAVMQDVGIGGTCPNCNHFLLYSYDGDPKDKFPNPKLFRYRCFTCEPEPEEELEIKPGILERFMEALPKQNEEKDPWDSDESKGPQLKIGTYIDGMFAPKDWYVINVATWEENPHANLFVPFIEIKTADEPIFVPVDKLNIVADAIYQAYDIEKKNVLVHCTAGIERSPLAVVWYFHVYHKMSFDEAYKKVKEIRPIAEDRRSWISYPSFKEFLRNTRESSNGRKGDFESQNGKFDSSFPSQK